jgi:uracil-DNA glycosylase
MTARDLAAAAGLAEVDDPRPAAALLASAASAAPAAPAAPPSPAHSAPAALPTLAADAADLRALRPARQPHERGVRRGQRDGGVVVVGEAPGQEEDRTGRPFVGRAGRLLDLLLMTADFRGNRFTSATC